MDIEIAIETTDNQLVYDLLEDASSHVQRGYQKVLANEATVTLQSIHRRRSIDVLPEIITFVVSIGTSVATDVISNWLCEKMKGKQREVTLRIERREIQIEHGEIKRIIEETIHRH